LIDIIEQFEKDGKIQKRGKSAQLGGTMRLGAYSAEITNKNSIAYRIYKGKVTERHRHRYEVDASYKQKFEQHGMNFSVISQDNLPEIVEIPSHKFFIGVQFHPEFKSNFASPSPIFKALIEKSLA